LPGKVEPGQPFPDRVTVPVLPPPGNVGGILCADIDHASNSGDIRSKDMAAA